MNNTYIVRYNYKAWPADCDYGNLPTQTDLVNASSRADAIRLIKDAERLDGCEIDVIYCNLAPVKGWR